MHKTLQVIALIWVGSVLAYERVTPKSAVVPVYVPTPLPPVKFIADVEDEDPQPEPYQVAHADKHPPGHPYQYKRPPAYCNANDTPLCAINSTTSYCLVDPQYPHDDVQAALVEDHMLARQYAEQKDQSADDLVPDIGKSRENALDYSHYTGDPFSRGNWIGGEGFICPSHVEYARPLRAQNIKGEWRVIVNDPSHCTQTQRVEICLHENAPCRTLAPCYKSRCLQKYTHHRILSFDPCYPERGIFFDMYKLPSACSCHLPSPA